MKTIVPTHALVCSILLGSAMALTVPSTLKADTTNPGTGVAITEQDESGNANPSFFQSFTTSGDLLNGLTPTASTTAAASTGNFSASATGGVGNITDGSVAPISTDHTTQAGVGFNHNPETNDNDGGMEVNYKFTGAVTLSSISFYGGWSDSGRSNIDVNAYYSTDGGATYTFLGTEDKVNGGGGPIAWISTFSSSGSTYFGNGAAITDLRFNFDNSQVNGTEGLSEIAAYGVPEPATWVMGAVLCGTGLLGASRRLRWVLGV